eukprot:TRINITY_DN22589_c0_g1_i1.p1 TRINITY_DN22589_c0_g1~~TRINITY_DN22589_c0_g1_i1.p1  ORF type:complete len:443 (+),score=138.37 TRINITY_DN22589_c0_g1_i1:44-1372(+)
MFNYFPVVFVVIGASLTLGQNATTVGFHPAVVADDGTLLPWKPLADVLDMEMDWYLACPIGEHGYPVYAYSTFMNGTYQTYNTMIIPAMQLGMGIISYVKYWHFTGQQNAKVIVAARSMAEYLIKEALSPDAGPYPRFPRSSGINTFFPLQTSGVADIQFGPQVLEPDKGGIAGYALGLLFNVTRERRYLDQALHYAERLTANMRPANATHAPWQFRVDSVNGTGYYQKNGNSVYPLRLFDLLIELGHTEFQGARDNLWAWILNYQIPSESDQKSSLWVNFFEDQIDATESNRVSWAPMEMARYLIEKKAALDPNWFNHTQRLLNFSLSLFGLERPFGVTIMGEQDHDGKPWGGANSKLGSIATKFACAGGFLENYTNEELSRLGKLNLNWITYFRDSDGCPAALEDGVNSTSVHRGGWQEDCHTDVVHSLVDALRALDGDC